MSGKRFLLFVLSMLLILDPVFAGAQGISAGGAYGQAVGSRRRVDRQVRGSSFGLEGQTMVDTEEQQSPESRAAFQPLPGGIGYQIHVLGQVNLPGTYRLPPSVRLDEVLNFSGGVKDMGSKRKIEVRRKNAVLRYDILKYHNNGDLSQNPFLLDNDVVFVPFSKADVAINGPVKEAGTYELIGNEKTAWDLVQLAGGYTPGASFTDPVTVVRYVNEKKKLFNIANSEEELKSFELQRGDVVIVSHILTADRNFDYNISALPSDNIFYPSFNDNVFVLGGVALPGAYPFNPHYSVNDFVSMAGAERHAKLNGVHILSSSGKKIRNRELATYRLSPGDTIVVPVKAWTANNVITWYNTLANSIITGFTLRELVRR